MSTPSQPSSIATAASRGGAHAGVDDDRHLHRLEDQAEVVRVADAQARADGRGQRHHRRAAGVLELPRDDRVVGGVGEDGEALLHQRCRAASSGLLDVGEERLLVADHLELHPLASAPARGQAAGADRVVGGVAAGGVGQERHAACGVDPVEERGFALAR